MLLLTGVAGISSDIHSLGAGVCRDNSIAFGHIFGSHVQGSLLFSDISLRTFVLVRQDFFTLFFLRLRRDEHAGAL